jgi:MFS family permease
VEKAEASTKPLWPGNRLQSPWFILIVVLLTSIAAPLTQFKVPPVMPLLMEAFGQSGSRAGLLMSVFALTGLLLAIPAGFILQRWGHRAVGLMAIFCLIGGAAAGAFSGGMATMLVSRFIEGAGMSLISVAAPAIIALWFASDKRGKAMGIWSIWVPLGSTIMFLLAPPLAGRWGWKGVWWFGVFYTLGVGLLFYLFVGSSPQTSPDRAALSATRGSTKQTLTGVLRNCDLWLISLVFCCFNFVYVAFITWAPTFLHQVRHATIARASLLVSVTSLLTIVAAPTAGWVSDRIGSRKVICTVPLLVMGFLFPLSSGVTENLFLVLAAGIGFAGGFVPTGVFTAGVEVVGDERMAGMAMAVIQIGQNSGMLLGPLVLGWAIQSGGGWQAAFWILAPVSILGAVAGWVARMK